MNSIDVVIPVYNGQKFIKDAINSCLNQTLPPKNIIIVNDGSSDNTIDEVKSINNKKIKLINIRHGGVSKARNVGIQKSTAGYIAFLDADDMWSKNKLEKQLQQMLKKPDTGVIYSGMQLIEESGKPVKNGKGMPYFKGYIFEDLLFYARPIHCAFSNVLVKRSVLLQTELFDEKMEFGEDGDLLTKLSRVTQFDYVKSVHVKRRINGGSVTRKKHKDIWVRNKKQQLFSFYFINKYAKTIALPKACLDLQRRRVLKLFFDQPTKIYKARELYIDIKDIAPDLTKQLKGNNLFTFYFFILIAAVKVVIKRVKYNFSLIPRLKLLFSEGTIFFSKAKGFNSEIEFLKKRM